MKLSYKSKTHTEKNFRGVHGSNIYTAKKKKKVSITTLDLGVVSSSPMIGVQIT